MIPKDANKVKRILHKSGLNFFAVPANVSFKKFSERIKSYVPTIKIKMTPLIEIEKSYRPNIGKRYNLVSVDWIDMTDRQRIKIIGFLQENRNIVNGVATGFYANDVHVDEKRGLKFLENYK